MRTQNDEHVNEIVFASDLIKIGRWRLPAGHARFRDSGPVKHYLVVFPRTSAWIQHAGDRPFVADPNIVTYYNRDQEYTRSAIAPVGDRCEYYAIAPDLLRQVVGAWDPAAAEEPSRIVRFARGPSDAQAYLTQRRLYQYVRRRPDADPLAVEEAMIEVLSRVVSLAYQRGATPAEGHRDLVERAREVIARTFWKRLTLTDLAASTGASVFHLCRVFRAGAGDTIHSYRNQLRLRAALERVLDSRTDLSAVALDLGYSTHSHFTAAFRAAYGITPSAAREGLRPTISPA